jgi:hypothetical protein
MSEIADHGQQLTLRTRRGADFALLLTLLDAPAPGGSPLDLTGATVVGRVFAHDRADLTFASSVNGPAGEITIGLSAAQTMNMSQDWQYVLGYKDAAGATHPLLFGQLFVSQERL